MLLPAGQMIIAVVSPTTIFADQLTLFEPERADYPHLLAPNVFHLPTALYRILLPVIVELVFK